MISMSVKWKSKNGLDSGLSAMKTSYFLSDITGQEFFLSVVSNFDLFLFLGLQPYFTNNIA
jgi:hypothetical protein